MIQNETEADEVEEPKTNVEGIPRVELVLPKIVFPIENIPLNPPSGKFFIKKYQKAYSNITESSGEGIRQNEEEEEPSADQPNRNNRPAGDLDNFLGAWKNLVNEVQETLGGVSDIEDSSDESLIDPMDFKFQKVR